MPTIPYYDHHNPPPRTPDDVMESLIKEFVANGGKIQTMRDDGGAYNKALKKTQKSLGGGFNPFSKDEACTINKQDFIKR
jgi:hypothetical protein